MNIDSSMSRSALPCPEGRMGDGEASRAASPGAWVGNQDADRDKRLL